MVLNLIFTKLCHFIRYKEYIKGGSSNPSNQTSITSYASSSADSDLGTVQIFSPKHPRQKAINDAVVKHLIVGCGLPVSLVESPHFRSFMNVCERR